MQIDRVPLPFDNWRLDWRDARASGPLTQIIAASESRELNHELLFQQLPDDTVALSFCDVASLSADDHSIRLQTALLKESAAIAAARGVQYARILVPESSETQISLQQAGFELVGKVDEWCRPVTPSELCHTEESAGLTFCILKASELCKGEQLLARQTLIDQANTSDRNSDRPSQTEDGTCVVSHHDLEVLLEDCLTHAIDLPQLPQPTVQQLLLMWFLASGDVRIVLALHKQQPIGLMVVNQESVSTTHSEGRPCSSIIDYVGVAAEHRRRGAASALLHQSLRHILCEAPTGSNVTAFAGSDNVPARAFYQRQQFQILETQDIWIRRLT